MPKYFLERPAMVGLLSGWLSMYVIWTITSPTPAQGATREHRFVPALSDISIHAPAQGATFGNPVFAFAG